MIEQRHGTSPGAEEAWAYFTRRRGFLQGGEGNTSIPDAALVAGVGRKSKGSVLGEKQREKGHSRNEYFGITLERAVKVLDALNVRLRTKVEIDNPSEVISA